MISKLDKKLREINLFHPIKNIFIPPFMVVDGRYHVAYDKFVDKAKTFLIEKFYSFSERHNGRRFIPSTGVSSGRNKGSLEKKCLDIFIVLFQYNLGWIFVDCFKIFRMVEQICIFQLLCFYAIEVKYDLVVKFGSDFGVSKR